MSRVISVKGVDVELRKHHFSKQLKLSVRAGRVIVTLPKRAPYRLAESFARSKSDWIQRQARGSQPLTQPSTTQREQARELLSQKLEQWAPQMGVSWGKLRIGNQSSRWGSCSSSGTLSFNWRVLYLPEPLLDYLVIHELAHVLHPNHSPQFWDCVALHNRHYKQIRKQLKQIDFADMEG